MRAVPVLRFVAVALSLAAAILVPVARADSLAPGASASIVINGATGEALDANAPDARRPIASTTKLMTALLVLEHAHESDVFTSPGYAAVSSEEVTIGLAKGERMTVHDLLRALLLPSANDSAVDLAVGVAGSVPAFVQEMNARARSLGLTETHYANPIGLDSPDNYSSARDLAKLAAHLMQMPEFVQIVSSQSAQLTSGLRPRTVINRNTLLGHYPEVNGVKTGHTVLAGDVLVASAAAHGVEVVSAVLGEPSEVEQNSDSIALLRYGLSQLRVVQPVTSGAVLAHPKVKYFGSQRVPLAAAGGVSLTVRRGAPVSVRVDAPPDLTGPLPPGKRVGTVTVSYENRPVRTVALVTAAPVRAASLLRKLSASPGILLAALACLGLAGAAAAWLVRGRTRRGARGERVSDDYHRHAQRGNR